MAQSYWGVEHGDSISKSDKEYTPWKSMKRQGLAFRDRDAAVSVGQASAKNYFSRDSAKTGARHVGTGAAVGAGAGALLSRGHNVGATAKGGAIIGGSVGAYTGSVTASNNAQRKAVKSGLKTGKIKRTDKKIGYWSGLEKS